MKMHDVGRKIDSNDIFIFEEKINEKLSDEYNKYNTLLLQIDTDDDIMWGDSGIANFFINKEDLENKNFKNILYNWDCC